MISITDKTTLFPFRLITYTYLSISIKYCNCQMLNKLLTVLVFMLLLTYKLFKYYSLPTILYRYIKKNGIYILLYYKNICVPHLYLLDS